MSEENLEKKDFCDFIVWRLFLNKAGNPTAIKRKDKYNWLYENQNKNE